MSSTLVIIVIYALGCFVGYAIGIYSVNRYHLPGEPVNRKQVAIRSLFSWLIVLAVLVIGIYSLVKKREQMVYKTSQGFQTVVTPKGGIAETVIIEKDTLFLGFEGANFFAKATYPGREDPNGWLFITHKEILRRPNIFEQQTEPVTEIVPA